MLLFHRRALIAALYRLREAIHFFYGHGECRRSNFMGATASSIDITARANDYCYPHMAAGQLRGADATAQATIVW